MSHLKPPIGDADHLQGPRNAPVSIVEFGDFECPSCGDAYPQLKTVQQIMGDRLCFVFRHFPLSQLHPHAERAAEFSEAAATVGSFWEIHDMLFENQNALDDRSLIRYAERLGIKRTLVDAALNGEFSMRVHEDFASGVRSGVNGTPTFFINGRRHDGRWDANTLLDAVKFLH
jgi:protein-disulfide isomerase